MQIREMQIEDAAAIAEIEKQCFSLPWPIKEIEETFLAKNSIFYVASIGGQIVGYAGLYFILDEGNIINIAVDSRYRRQGIAKGLLEHLILQLKHKGVKNVTLEVRKGNMAAISLYESFGFETVGIRKNFYVRPLEDALIMWKYQLSTSENC